MLFSVRWRILALIIIFPTLALAEKVQILHDQIAVKELPYPGQKIELTAEVAGTKDTDLTMTAFVVLDGLLMDVPMVQRLDERSRIYYDLTLGAPLAELTYQFFLMKGNEAASISKRYSVRRSCLPDVELTDPEISQDLEPKKRVLQIQKVVDGLKRDIDSYSRSIELLTKIKEITDQKSSEGAQP